jgi:hypothetical protein
VSAVLAKIDTEAGALMPNRIISEKCRTSPTLAALTSDAERLWWRLVTAVDDYGRFEADPCLVRGLCVARLKKWNDRRVAKCLEEFALVISEDEGPLVSYYTVAGRRFGQLTNWSRHQRPPRLAPKFPGPSQSCAIPSEKTIHDKLVEHLNTTRTFCGHTITAVDRNVRAGNGFADLLLSTEFGRILVELKRTRADAGAIKQVSRYQTILKDIASVVIIAAGLGSTVGHGDFVKFGISLITYDEHGDVQVLVPNALINQCDDLVIHVKSFDLQQWSESGDESRESGDESRDPGAVRERREELSTSKQIHRKGMEECPPEVREKFSRIGRKMPAA